MRFSRGKQSNIGAKINPAADPPAGAVEYALTFEDFGQGSGATILPVSRLRGELAPGRSDRPCTLHDVLTRRFGEDFHLLLTNFVEMEASQLRRLRCFRGAERFQLLGCAYVRSESAICQPTEKTVVDVIVKGAVRGMSAGRQRGEGDFAAGAPCSINDAESANDSVVSTVAFRIRYVLDLRQSKKRCIGPLIGIYELSGEDPVFHEGMIRTNQYLLPILYDSDYEPAARDMLIRYYPEAVQGGKICRELVVEGEELARRMGLKIEIVRFADRDIRGQIYFAQGKADIVDDFGGLRTIAVAPRTILLSADECASPGRRNSTLLHECCHFHLNQLFFLLQGLMGGPDQPCVSRRRGRRRCYDNKSAMDWMELQAEKLPAFVLMERENTLAFVEAELKRRGGKRTCEVLRGVLFAVADHFLVTPSMARIRLIELGYPQMRGIYNYLDGAQIPDHSCAGEWEAGVSYTISPADAAALIGEHEAFDLILRSGRYVYVEGHFCLRSERYVRRDSRGQWHLTGYARSHIDECCLAFTVSGRHARDAAYHAGFAARNAKKPVTDRYLGGYQLVAEPGTKAYAEENDVLFEDGNRWGELLFDMPNSLCEAVQKILARKGLTQERLALELGIDRKTLYDALRSKAPRTGLMVAICVALKLPYYISIEIVEGYGPRLRNTQQDNLYRQMLLEADQLTIERCDELLRAHQMPMFFKNVASF